MYLDDHRMYDIGNEQSSVASELRETARTTTSWYDSNLPAGNLKKYQTMNIGYGEDKNDATYTVYVNSEEIKTVGKLELLDSKLNFTDQISSICKKASRLET